MTERYLPSYHRPITPSYRPHRLTTPYQCRQVVAPPNGLVINDKDSHCQSTNGQRRIGKVCEFACKTNFVLVGSDSTKCTSRGWNSPLPRCEPSRCPSLRATEGMTIAPIHCQAGEIIPGNKCQVHESFENRFYHTIPVH